MPTAPASQVTDVAAVATRLADEELFPAAGDIERADVVPVAWLDRLADAGLYGLFGPTELGGADADAAAGGAVIEALAGASLTTTLVWIQHHSVVRAVRSARPELRDRWLADLVAGRVRAGIAYAALRRPGPPAMTATAAGNGWTLEGGAPWVSGWDRISLLYVGAVAGHDVVWALVDPSPAPTVETRPLRLAAVGASSTVALALHGHPVAPDRVVDVEPVADWRRRDGASLRTNGHLALGVADRCARLLDSHAAAARVDAARLRLVDAPDAGLPEARAGASVLAVQLASALVATGGGRSADWDSDAARLARDATFLLVFGQTRPVRAAQLEVLDPPR